MAFRDNQGYTWSNELDVPAAKRVRDLVGVNLLKDQMHELFDQLSDPVTLIDVLYAINKPAADQAGVHDDEFGRRCVQDLTPAVEDLFAQLADFFLRLGRSRAASTLAEILSRSKALMEKTQTPETDAALQKAIDEVFEALEAKIPGKQSTASPA